jgi:hypothetical protein
VLAWRAPVDGPGLAPLGLKRHKLLVSASGRWSIGNFELTRLQQRMKQFEQMGAANSVNQHRRIFDRPALKIHAIARATDLKPNHARAKRLVHRLGVGRVVAEIRDNETLGIIMAIDRRELARTRTSIKPLGELVGMLNPN